MSLHHVNISQDLSWYQEMKEVKQVKEMKEMKEMKTNLPAFARVAWSR